MTRPRLSHSALPRRLSLLTRQQSTATAPSPSHRHHHQRQQPPIHDPYALLSRPTWSVRALLPHTTDTTTTTTITTTTTPSNPPHPTEVAEDETITPSQLHHLHRLSALPPPPNPSTTSAILSTLHAQLHFVRAIQRVDTSSVPPLASIRDETLAGQTEAAITLDTPAVREALEGEVAWGRCRRPRRQSRQSGRGKGGLQGGLQGGVLGEGEGAGKREVGGNGGERGDERKMNGVEEWDVLGSAAQKAGGGRYFVVRSGKGVQDANGGGSGIAG